MTDNEIIKALECCRDNDNNLNMEKCFEVCPYDGECAGKFMQDVLSLINRQKEEIKRLKNRDLQVEVSEKLEREIKAEAVKEFAEKLKFVWFDNRYDSPDIDFDYFVDILVEALVGDTE